jgi:diguanylate cyclase (GGDEF)-like protein
MDNFKAYNDVYGFENGDRVIRLLADVLTAQLPEGQFVGHVGGDDFVVILSDGSEAKFCKKVMGEFKDGVSQYYNPRDVQNGYITAENRNGVVEKFPLVTLSAAGINGRKHHFSNLLELTEELAKLKKKSKKQKGNSCCWL